MRYSYASSSDQLNSIKSTDSATLLEELLFHCIIHARYQHLDLWFLFANTVSCGSFALSLKAKGQTGRWNALLMGASWALTFSLPSGSVSYKVDYSSANPFSQLAYALLDILYFILSTWSKGQEPEETGLSFLLRIDQQIILAIFHKCMVLYTSPLRTQSILKVFVWSMLFSLT